MPNVSFVRPELNTMRKSYDKIEHALAGEEVIKSKGAAYLPPPEPVSTKEGAARYYAYKTRAVFYNVTKRTQQGLLGQLFSREPQIEVPSYLQATVASMDGSGVNAMQQTKGTCGHVIAMGRGGLLSDFPTVNGTVTAADLQSGRVKPSITFYEATKIINWRYARDGSNKKLLFVILEETREIYKDNDFSFTKGKQWRVLRLDEGGFYIQELYNDNKSQPVATFRPTDYDGNRLDAIPFEFIGAEDNDPDIDDPPMYSIASLNIAHYRNSADFEDSTFLVGQPTIVLTGLTKNWCDEVLGGGAIRFGSRNAIPLPVGADIKLVQADPNTLAQAGMELKEKQMVALGAKLVELRQVQRTATEAAQEEVSEASVLQTVADNASVAYAQAFANAGRFVSGNDEGIKYRINTAFEISTMDANSRAETIKEWQMGALTYEEMRQVLRRCGVATLPDDEAKRKSLEEETQRAKLMDAALGEGGSTGATGATGA